MSLEIKLGVPRCSDNEAKLATYRLDEQLQVNTLGLFLGEKNP